MTNTEIARQTLTARETALRAKIAGLAPTYLVQIGLTTPQLIEQHIADEMADEAEALGL